MPYYGEYAKIGLEKGQELIRLSLKSSAAELEELKDTVNGKLNSHGLKEYSD